MSAVGYATIPVTLSFANAAKAVQSQLKPQLDKLSKDAAKGIEKNVASAAEQAGKKVERARQRETKATEAATAAESKFQAEVQKREGALKRVESATLNLEMAQRKSADAVEKAQAEYDKLVSSGTASAEQLAAAERKIADARDKGKADVLKREEQLDKARSALTTQTQRVADAEVKLKSAKDKAAEASERVLAATKQLDDAQEQAERSSKGLSGALTSMGDAAAQAAEKSGGLGQKLMDGFKTVGKGALLGVGAKAGSMVMDGVHTAFSKGFARLESIEQAEKMLQGLGHSATSVDAIMDNAMESVKGTAYGFGEAASMAATFVGAGVQEGEDLTRVLKLVGDTAAITGADFQEMGSIWTKIAGNQKLTTEELNQLMDRGLGLLPALQEKYNITAEEARKMVTEGKISFEDFAGVMEDMVGGSAQTMGDTFKGSLSNMQAALGRFGAQLLEPVFANAPAVFAAVGAAVDDLAKRLEPVIAQVSEWLAPKMQWLAETVVPMVADAFLGVVDQLITFGDWVQRNTTWLLPLGAALGVVSGALALVALQSKIATAGGFLTWVVKMTAKTKAWELATKAAAGAQKLLNLAMNMSPMGRAITIIAAVTAALTVFFTKTEVGQRIWGQFMDLLRRAGDWLGSTFGPMFEALGETIGRVFGTIKDTASEIFNILFKGEYTGEGSLFGLNDESSTFVDVLFRMRETVISVKDAVGAAFEWMGDKWEEFTTGVGQFYDTWVAPAWELFRAGTELLASVVAAQWQAIADGARSMWDTISPIFTFILDGWRILSDGIAAVGSTVIQAVWLGIQSGAQLMWNVLRGVFDQIKIGFELVGTVLRSVWDNMIAPVFGIFREGAGLLADVLTGNFSNIGNRFSSMGEHLRTVVMGPINVAKDTFVGLIRAMGQTMDNLKATAARAVSGVLEKMREMVRVLGRIPGQVGDIFANAGRWLVNAGKNIVQGLINGILSMGSKIGDAISSIMPSSIGGLIGFSGGGALPGYAAGGLPSEPGSGLLPRIPGIPRSVRDPIIGFNRAGLPIARIEPEEFIVNREDTAKNLDLLRAINSGAKIIWQAVSGGRAGGPAVAGELPAYAGGGVIQPMINTVKSKYPMMTVTSTVRPGDGGYHGAGLAVDFSNGTGNTPQMLALAKDIASTYPNSLELIYDDPGFAQTIKNGKVVGRFGQFYTLAQAGPHHHHVHWAMRNAPTRALGSSAGNDGGGDKEVKKGPANLPPMKWSENGLTVNAVRAGRAIALQFPEVKTIGGYRPVDPYPDHPSGRALDVMTYADQALGDRILNYLFDNNGFFKMQYAIWKQAMWYKKSAPQPMADRGSPTQNHMDHVHAYFHPSPRVTGNEVYPNTINAGGGGKAVMEMGDANLPLEIGKGAKDEGKDVAKTINVPNVDYGTAAQLASKWESDTHRDAALREYLGRKAKVYDTGGLLPTGGVAVNLGKPELIFPADATTALLQQMRHTPQYVAAMQELAKRMPALAASIDKLTGLDYGAIAREVTAAFDGRDAGYAELARAVGEDVADRIVTEIAFIGDQIRDMQDGSNMRAYLANMSVSEGVGLADQVGQLAGIKSIGSTFGGVAKAYDGMKDAAVMQVDAANAVTEAEENLAEVRRQYAEMLAESGADPEVSKKTQRKIDDAERKLREAKEAPAAKSDVDGAKKAKKIADAERALARVREDASEELKKSGAKNTEELLKASEAVTAAEQERTKALGVVKMAAQATGQAQIAMALEVAEMVIGIGKQIWGLIEQITDLVNQTRIKTRTAVWELTKSWSELTGVVDQHRGMVAQLQMQLVNAAVEVISKSMEMRTAQVDVVRAQLEGAKNVSEAEAALQAERDKVMGKQKWNFRDMSLEYDRFRDGYRKGMTEQIAGMTHLSDKERARILSTLTGVGQLGDEERARVFGAVAGMSDLDVREKERITAALAGVGELTVEERARVANAIANMGDLSAEERERIIRAINGVTEVAEEERLRVVAALTGLGRIDGRQDELTNRIVANVDKEGLAAQLGLDAKLAAQKAADDAYVASVMGREVGEKELHQLYKLQLAEQLVGEQAFQDLKAASLDAQLDWQKRVDKAAQLGLEAELKARAAVTPEILALQREVYAAEFAQQKSILDAQIKGLEASFAQQQAIVTMGRLQDDLARQSEELARLSGQTMGMTQGQAIVMEEIARLRAQNAEILGKRNSAGAGARNFFGRLFDWNGDGNNGTNTWSVERRQYDAQIAANNKQIAELQKSVYAKGAFTPAQQKQIDEATRLAAKYFAQGNEAAAKAALQASPLGNAQRSLEVNKTLSRITDWEKQQRDLQRSQQDMLAELRKDLKVLPLQWRSEEAGSRESAQRYAADALRSDNDGVRDALATLARLEESNAAELKQLREKPTVVNVTVSGPRDGVTTIGQMEDALVELAGELGATRTTVKRLDEARRTSASDRVRAAIGKY